jgi:hypothetical protein
MGMSLTLVRARVDGCVRPPALTSADPRRTRPLIGMTERVRLPGRPDLRASACDLPDTSRSTERRLCAHCRGPSASYRVSPRLLVRVRANRVIHE